MTQNETNNGKEHGKEHTSTKHEVSVWLALIGFGLLIVGTILSSIAAVIHFTSESRAEIASGDTYFMYGITMVVGGTILSKIGLGGLPHRKKKNQQQHKITAWFVRNHKEQEEELREKEDEEIEQQQQQKEEKTPLTADKIKKGLTVKDKRIMRVAKVAFIIGLVLFGLAIILAYALDFRNLYYNIATYGLIIAGAIVYLWALGRVSTRIKQKEKKFPNF